MAHHHHHHHTGKTHHAHSGIGRHGHHGTPHGHGKLDGGGPHGMDGKGDHKHQEACFDFGANTFNGGDEYKGGKEGYGNEHHC